MVAFLAHHQIGEVEVELARGVPPHPGAVLLHLALERRDVRVVEHTVRPLLAVLARRAARRHARVEVLAKDNTEQAFPADWLTPMITSNAPVYTAPDMHSIRESVRTPADKYEWLAWPYEVKYFGYKLH